MQGIRYECNLLATTRALKLMPNYVKDLGYSCRFNLDVGSSICGVYMFCAQCAKFCAIIEHIQRRIYPH